MDEIENDALTTMSFPRTHCPQIYSTTPLACLNAEIKGQDNVSGISPLTWSLSGCSLQSSRNITTSSARTGTTYRLKVCRPSAIL